MTRYASAPIRAARKSQCSLIEKPCGTLSVVHSRYAEPGVSASVERMTMWPENGSCFQRNSNAGVQLVVGDAPCDERAGREIRRHQRLADAANRARGEHRAEPFVHRRDVDRRQPRDLGEWVAQESGDPVFGNREDARVDRVGNFDGNRCIEHDAMKVKASTEL